MLPIRQQLDPDDRYTNANKVEYIVLHDTGNKTDSDEANANYFCGGYRKSSAHYFVDDDSITQLVLDKDGAFHCGDGNGKYGITNRNSIGIEMCRVNNTVTVKTESNTIELVKYLMKKYNVPISKVVRHYDASRKPCPGSFITNNWARWSYFKSKLTDIPVPVTNEVKVKYGSVTATTLNIRDGAGTNYKIIGTVKKGEKIKILKESGEWYKIEFKNQEAWVSKAYVKLV